MQKNTTIFRVLFALLLTTSISCVFAQTSCPGFPNMIQVKRPNLTIGTYIKGLLEYTPPGYNPLGTQRYPLIIYFHGVGEVGLGTNTSLCSILTLFSNGTDNNPFDIPLPERIERGELPTVTNGGNTYQYIVLSPQYSQYDYPDAYPSAPDVEAMINYAVANYKVDINRIYLTGYSSGANMVLEFAGSTLQRAQRAAAIALASVCTPLANMPGGPANIANANLAVWEIHCLTDDNPDCPNSTSSEWINAINANIPPPTPLAKKTTLPITGWPCNTGFTHNTWNTFYDPAFTDGGPNVYNFLIQFARNIALPAKIKDYAVRLERSKVIIEWTTTNESNTDRFIVERGGSNQNFEVVSEIPAAGYSSVDKKYSLVDEQPFPGTNYYRLSLVNKDRQRENFEIKKLVNPTSWAGKVNIPNPARGTLDIYINLDKKERIQIQVFDLNGRLMKEVKKEFNPGLTENKIDVSSLSHGTYLIRVTGETISVNKKIIVN